MKREIVQAYFKNYTESSMRIWTCITTKKVHLTSIKSTYKDSENVTAACLRVSFM
jgi:hypothetical protein